MHLNVHQKALFVKMINKGSYSSAAAAFCGPRDMNSSELKQILQEIDIQLDVPDNESESKAVFDLFQLVELLNKKTETLKIENQKLCTMGKEWKPITC